MSRLQSRRSSSRMYRPMAAGGSSCGSVTVVEEAADEPTGGDVPVLPYIGPLTADNPRALVAGAALGTLVITRL